MNSLAYMFKNAVAFTEIENLLESRTLSVSRLTIEKVFGRTKDFLNQNKDGKYFICRAQKELKFIPKDVPALLEIGIDADEKISPSKIIITKAEEFDKTLETLLNTHDGELLVTN